MASFKWVNTTLGNIKCAITGTYRKLGPDHAGRYLASFAWRYNRRYQLQTMIPRFVHRRHDQVDGGEPECQRQLGRVEDRARRGRCLLLAPVALIETPTRQPLWTKRGIIVWYPARGRAKPCYRPLRALPGNCAFAPLTITNSPIRHMEDIVMTSHTCPTIPSMHFAQLTTSKICRSKSESFSPISQATYQPHFLPSHSMTP